MCLRSQPSLSTYRIIRFCRIYGTTDKAMTRLCSFNGGSKSPLFSLPQTYTSRNYTRRLLYNWTPLNPNFCIVKLGFTGVYIICLISTQNIDCEHSLKPPRRGGSNEYSQSMFWATIWKNVRIFIWKLSVFGGEIVQYIWIGVFS